MPPSLPPPPEAIRHAVRQLDDASLADLLHALERDVHQLRTAASIRAAHDALLFALAHPPSERVRADAERCLHALVDHVAGAVARDAKLTARLRNSGIAGTHVEVAFSFAVVRWLVQEFPRHVAFDVEHASPELAQLFVRSILTPPEHEQLERSRHRLAHWLKVLGPADARERLAALVAWVKRATGDEAMREYLFASLGVFTRWTLAPGTPSLSSARSLPRATFLQRDWTRAVSADEWVRRPLPRPARLDAASKKRLTDAARGALACMLRETEPLTHTDAHAVELFRLERGVDVALFGMKPAHRLGLESYVGYLAFRNGVPAAYGGAWTFGDRCKIGINVFPWMRGGESALLLAQLMRVYRQHFGPTTFFVEPYQIGKGNPDGIRSGAFWFYYRLGFRPVQPALAALAQREFEPLGAGRRTAESILKKLAHADLCWKPAEAGARPIPDPYAINRALAAWIAREHGGDRTAALRATRRATLALFRGMAKSAAIDAVHRTYGPLLALMPEAHRWRESERRKLFECLRHKVAGSERAYNKSLLGLPRLVGAFERLAEPSAGSGSRRS